METQVLGMEKVKALGEGILENMRKVIFGKDEVLRDVVICLMAGGHLLLEDIPGTGKTTLAKALARSVGGDCTRVQFTPDLLPSDLTGIRYYDQKEQVFVLKKGAVFTNILLADEINRASPRTQSSLLECMQEEQVTIDGVTHRLADPFFVIATQNPIELQGTFLLPEAQLDRFLMRLSMGYPDGENEKRMLLHFAAESPLETLRQAAAMEDLLAARALVRRVFVGDAVADYILALVKASREDEELRLGVSPRGSLALLHAAQAHAALEGRGFLLPDDVKLICPQTLGHRVICKGARTGHQAAEAGRIINQILARVPVPTEA